VVTSPDNMHVNFISKTITSLALLYFGGVSDGDSQTTQPLLDRAGWSFADPDAWEWRKEGDETELVLKQATNFKPKVRSPFHLAWFEGSQWASFTLTAEVRLDLFSKGNNDVCIAFGKESETKFYYAHLGEKSDAVHLQLQVVNDSDRRAITEKGAKTLPWEKGKWHKVKLERDSTTGRICIWFDGKEVLSATDKTLGKGGIGLGSFDDLGSFRNVEVSPR
jgi:hypothetical protein